MSILSDFEDRVAGAVEGMFAGVFRAPVQPAELARACAREMDRRRKLGVGKVYAPTMYSVLLSAADGEQLGGFATTLSGELETYLVGYAREKSYELATRPRVRFLVDDALKLGRFEVIGELLSAEEMAAQFGDDDAHDEDFAGSDAASSSVPQPAADAASLTQLSDGRSIPLTGERLVIGRLDACDICLEDRNASREHAAIVRDGAGWAVMDLGSTNGTLLNGERAERARLREGDIVTVGVTEFVFHDVRDARTAK